MPLTNGNRFEHGLEVLEALVKTVPGMRPTYFERGVQVLIAS